MTEHNFKTGKNYQDYINDKVGLVVNNYGKRGTGWRTPSTVGGTDGDLIAVFTGTNDYAEVGSGLVGFAYGIGWDSTGNAYSENISLINCQADNNKRQGLSLCSCKNVNILNCNFKNTIGTNSQFGINIEPDLSQECMENVNIVNCLTENKAVVGYQ
ncbi:hypothetical protein [Clostridium estertheticum]|uniref:hypothetical protein n=1 Tax=Clostridium estertheticum TaxID=238834 RepID=UPI001CF19936|nr:hypothetical protein [Clostridium estertheticum]MCB2339599.1 hypothetical protein [Clostridium estertheticum]